MNILYRMKYQARFNDIIDLIKDSDTTILELCFGDTLIAQTCKERGIEWIGYDINEYFVSNAKAKGFNATKQDISELEKLPQADLCIMCGSLYHFIPEIEMTLNKMLTSSSRIIISEPIKNLSSNNGMIGKISRILTNAGKGHENFRFDRSSIIETLEKYKKSQNYTYKIISTKRDILIEINHDRN